MSGVTFAQCVYDLSFVLGHVIDTSVEIGSPFIQSVARVVTSTVKEQPSECGARYGCPTGIGNDNFNYTVWMELM